MVERDSAEKVIESETLLEAVNANPFVIKLMDEDVPKLPYPTRDSILPGSMDEAQYIWMLL